MFQTSPKHLQHVLSMAQPVPLNVPYDGPEAESIYFRSYARWQTALRTATSTQYLPANSFNLEAILSRTPSLPETIPRDATSIEGYATWVYSDPSCTLPSTGRPQRFMLRRRRPIVCEISSSASFSAWDGTPNNGIALLALGWAYILTADLAERQGLSMEYGPFPNEHSGDRRSLICLDYALPQERAWWKALVAPGMGCSIAGDISPDGDTIVSPWAVQVQDIGVDISGTADASRRPPTAREAAGYVARLCRAFGLGDQGSAALAAALSFPLHASTVTGKSATIELPRPSLTSCLSRPGRGNPPAEFFHIGYYMALSICPGIFGPLLWSVFWEPGVPCNFAGAWLAPIDSVLRPIIEVGDLQLLAKVMSCTRVTPLWLGLALCGPRAIIKSILPSLTQLREYYHAEPNINAAAWTGIAQSFLHIHLPGPHDGLVSRADVWRLRYECYREYEDTAFKHPPAHGWPPFGSMREEDVELEIRHHLRCSHQRRYSHWTWEEPRVTDAGFSTVCMASPTVPPPQTGAHLGGYQGGQYPAEAASKISRKATEKIFWWSCSQVEQGFGTTLVPRLSAPDEPLHSDGSDSSFSAKDIERIDKWLQKVEKGRPPESCDTNEDGSRTRRPYAVRCLRLWLHEGHRRGPPATYLESRLGWA